MSIFTRNYGSIRKLVRAYILGNGTQYEGRYSLGRMAVDDSDRMHRSEVGFIWDAYANNILLLINRKNTILMRPTSMFFDSLSTRDEKVVKHKDLSKWRGHVTKNFRRRAMISMLVTNSLRRLAEPHTGDLTLCVIPEYAGNIWHHSDILSSVQSSLYDRATDANIRRWLLSLRLEDRKIIATIGEETHTPESIRDKLVNLLLEKWELLLSNAYINYHGDFCNMVIRYMGEGYVLNLAEISSFDGDIVFDRDVINGLLVTQITSINPYRDTNTYTFSTDSISYTDYALNAMAPNYVLPSSFISEMSDNEIHSVAGMEH